MKVIFNIKKLQVSKITAISDAGVPTYATPIIVPGTVSLSMESESTVDPFYADGIAYYMPSGATSTTGTLENALLPDQMLKDIYGYVEDTNGNKFGYYLNTKVSPYISCYSDWRNTDKNSFMFSLKATHRKDKQMMKFEIIDTKFGYLGYDNLNDGLISLGGLGSC